MPRWELEERGTRRFWEVEVEGRVVRTRFGKVSAEGQTSETELRSPVEADSAAKVLIASKEKKGYRRVEAQPAAAPKDAPELLARIDANPADEAAYLVYGDWLQAHGNPRGELISLQHALSKEKDPARFAALRKSEQALLSRAGDVLLGEIATRVGTSHAAIVLEWSLGFIRSAKVHGLMLDSDSKAQWPWVERLLDHPSSRFLRALSMIGPVDLLRRTIERLGSSPPRLLDSVTLRVNPGREALTTLGAIDAAVRAIPKLRSLTVSAPGIRCESLPAESLETLRLSAMNAEIAALFPGRTWPRLSTLYLGFASQQDSLARWVEPVLDASRFPALRSLTIDHVPFLAALYEGVVASPLLRQLEKLSMKTSRMTEAEAHVLLRNAKLFAHLERLDLGYLSEHGLSPAMERQLKALCPRVDLYVPRAQQGDEWAHANAAENPEDLYYGQDVTVEDRGNRYDEVEE